MNFKAWLNEIAGYGDLVPGWRGEPEGPFEDPKRMQFDPKFWRDYYYKKEKAEKELEKAKQELEEDPSREAKKKYGQAMAGSLMSAIPTIPEGKPREEYQGWTNWDTWAVALWASNESESYKFFRKYARTKDPAKHFKRYVKQHKSQVDEIAAHKVDLDFVNWEEIVEHFLQD